jgi:plasmid segregation protein ParM
VWGRATDATFQTAATKTGYVGDDLTDDDGDWLVGEKALKHIAPAALRNLRGRTSDESRLAHLARLRLAKTAFGKLFSDASEGDVVHVRLATGLPVDHMDGSADFKQLLAEQHRVQTDTADFVVNVVACFVMPQPYGTIYQQMIRSDGSLNPYYAYERTAVMDVGTYTLDAAFDDDGEYIDSRSGSAEAGIHLVQMAIATEYERRYKQKPAYRDVETGVRTGAIRVRGEWDDFTEVRQRAVDDLCAAALNLATSVWQAAADIDVIFVTGGGASLVVDALRAQFPQAVLADNAGTANAEGYRHYALNVALEV